MLIILSVVILCGQGIMNCMNYYEVAPTKIVRKTSDTFTYSSQSELAVGQVVLIPVGKQTLTGVVMRATTKPSYATKPIDSVLAIEPLPEALIATASWMSGYYLTPLATVLQTVLPRGITKKRRASTARPPEVKRDRTNIVFTKEQSQALDTLATIDPGTVILHGVTGSGKTAVYIEHARRTLATGKSVIVLVPEIALTSQLFAEFQNHFPDIILTHSKQTEAERHLAWQSALTSTSPRIVIGPRSALFLPLKSIGAIIIDEAHEPSFKQEQSPKYSALRVASVLAKHHEALVVQGSATPLISEYYLAEKTSRPILTLSQKARRDAADSTVSVVDMTKKAAFSRHRFFSDRLLDQIAKDLESNHQSLVFHNRRGSASTTLCKECGWSAICPRCLVPFTLHADIHQLRCHICDLRDKVPTSCPVCHSTDIVHKGIGTKLIEAELRKLFPKASIARFDGDANNDDTVEKRYQDLYDGAIDIIIGTQVIAKGLDLPHLRTVGVIQADAGLALPDFAASERTFQLLAQVVGRVGRSHHPTEVIVQSYQPTSGAVSYGIRQDFARFYDEAIAERKQSNFPPFTYLLKLTCVYKTEATVVRHAKAMAETLRTKHPDVTIFGPTPAFYERQHDTYRWQIIVKSTSRSKLTEIIHELPDKGWQFDIDPASLL